MRHTPGPENTSEKLFYVSWVSGEGLDACSLHGPHTRENAQRICDELHSQNTQASVIDCKTSLKKTPTEIAAPEMLEALERLLDPKFRNDTGWTVVARLVKKARGEKQ